MLCGIGSPDCSTGRDIYGHSKVMHEFYSERQLSSLCELGESYQ
jgi:hypothetical protein